MFSPHFGEALNQKVLFRPQFSPPSQGNSSIDQGLWDLGVSPIQANSIRSHLSRYPDRLSALALGEGLLKGFRLMYSGPRLPGNSKNLTSAHQHLHKHVLQDKIDKEVELRHIAGPFKTPLMHNFHISPVGVVSKADGGWRMIMHLSYLPFISVNDNIDPIYTTVTYTSFDKAIQTISQVGSGAVIAKCDIKSAFRLIRVYPGDFELWAFALMGTTILTSVYHLVVPFPAEYLRCSQLS